MKDNNQSKQAFKDDLLKEKGLNIHAIFDLNTIPDSLINSIKCTGVDTDRFNQLIVVGHLGGRLWDCVTAEVIHSDHPVDDFTLTVVKLFFKQNYSNNQFEIIYPGEQVIGLQQLGTLAGWHFSSPFKVGVNDKWGSWFAYRAVLLADTDFAITSPLDSESPCIRCQQKPCIKACPADALASGELNFDSCINYRKQPLSSCQLICHARVSCPAGAEYCYSDEQLNYHYAVSMKTIEEFY